MREGKIKALKPLGSDATDSNSSSIMTSSAVRYSSMAWDPKAPSALLLPCISDFDRKLEFNDFFASDGIGAHPVETSTLLKILSAATTDSKNYRGVLHSCVTELMKLQRSTPTKDDGINHDRHGGIHPMTSASLELLKLLYAITHLTETHVLQTPTMADTIAYLRHHHMEMLDVADILETSRHPEQLDSYWTMLRKLVARGCLSDAWCMLSYHSACQRAFASDMAVEQDDTNTVSQGYSYQARRLEFDREGFLAIRAILELAPIPGGRTDLHDSGNPEEDDLGMEIDEHLTTLPYMMGVRPLDYKLWTTNPQAALSVWRQWQSQIDTLTSFLRREPRLRPILQILKGDFSLEVFEDWSEALCAELLYVRPHLRPADLPIRMARTMQSYGEPPNVILAILQGDHGAVLETLYTKLGGGSGAALPSTMTSLLCNLLVDAKRLPDTTTMKNLQTNLLIEAAEAILSSHRSNTDIGMRLVALLLIPHCSANKGEHGLRITATLAESLERHCPNTDPEAHLLLDLVRPLVEKKKSERVLDGCVSMLVGLFRQLVMSTSKKTPSLIRIDSKRAMEWLIVGNDLESLLLSQGVCYRLIVTECMRTSMDHLHLLIGKSLGDRHSKIMIAEGYQDALEDKLQDVPAVRLLSCMTTMTATIMQKQNNRSRVVAENITKCLKGLAMPSMHWDFLQLAKGILDSDFQRYTYGDKRSFEPSFHVQDMHALMECFVLLTTLKDKSELNGVDELNHALAQGLMRAFIAENAKLKESNPKPATDVSMLRSTHIHTYTIADQELLVSSMLDLY